MVQGTGVHRKAIARPGLRASGIGSGDGLKGARLGHRHALSAHSVDEVARDCRADGTSVGSQVHSTSETAHCVVVCILRRDRHVESRPRCLRPNGSSSTCFNQEMMQRPCIHSDVARCAGLATGRGSSKSSRPCITGVFHAERGQVRYPRTEVADLIEHVVATRAQTRYQPGQRGVGGYSHVVG